MGWDMIDSHVALGRTELSGDGQHIRAWVVANDMCSRAMLVDTAQAVGVQVTLQLSVAEALERIDDRPFDTLVLVDIADDARGGTDALLDRIDLQARDADNGAVISFSSLAIDRVFARVTAPFVTLLCDPTPIERILAISTTNISAARAVSEIDPFGQALRLQRLADEVGQVARTLSELSAAGITPSAGAVSDGLVGYREGPGATPAVRTVDMSAGDIRTLIRLRRQRDRVFSAALFADPAWDMILDLMAARMERGRVAVSSLCIAAAVPPTTALRWIRTLTDMGIFRRVADANDGRRVFIELTDAAADKMYTYLSECKGAGALPV